MQKQSTPWYIWAILLGGIWLAAGQPGISLPSIGGKTTQATYVTDDRRSCPGPVSAGLQALNKQGILATVFEKGTVDGTGEVPDQYKAANAAATEIPALVIQAGDSVTRVVKDPKTTEQVLEAAR